MMKSLYHWIFILAQYRCGLITNWYIETAHFHTEECAIGYRCQYGTVIKTALDISLLQCSEICLAEPGCNLFNWFQATATCELRNYNGYILETQLCNMSLSAEPGAVAYFDVSLGVSIENIV